MSRCQMKLLHSETSFALTFDRIEVARQNSAYRVFRPTLDQPLLKLTERKLLTHLVCSCDEN